MSFTKLLVVLHRYLGTGCCIFFLAWLVSGVVMVYWQYPQITDEERLESASTPDFPAVRVAPEQALRRSGLERVPRRIVLGTELGRPVYRLLPWEGSWRTVYADDGSPLALDAGQAREVAANYLAVRAEQIHFVDKLETPDQWTLRDHFEVYFPFFHFSLNDGPATEIYVSGATGEPVQLTTRRSRIITEFGAILHWWYWTPLRVHGKFWSLLVMSASGIGAFMCVAGIVIGLTFYSPAKRYRGASGDPKSSPYQGWKLWHHYIGLIFGVFTFTWVFSGMLSFTPFSWAPGTSPQPAQALALAGGELALEKFPLDALRAAGIRAGAARAREVEFLQVAGKPYFEVRYASAKRKIISAETGAEFHYFQAKVLEDAARAVAPDGAISESALLDEYDAYYYNHYYDRNQRNPLPVLRVKLHDDARTWLYISLSTGSIVEQFQKNSRMERWIYHGLHSLDFPMLYRNRPAWDIVVIGLSVGAFAASLTGLVIGWRWLKASLRLWRKRSTKIGSA